MARESVDQYVNGKLVNGYDYINKAWVQNGVYVSCGHPEEGQAFIDPFEGPSTFEGCNCYARMHVGELARVRAVAGEPPFGLTVVQELIPLNGHHNDCDDPEEPYHNIYCSELCPLQRHLGGLTFEEEESALPTGAGGILVIVPSADTLIKEWALFAEGMLDNRQLGDLAKRSRLFVEHQV